jgi:RHS repeat-associated protein
MDKGSQSSKEANASQETSSPKNDLIAAPSISLPKGGGAIKGMGEKFAANPVTGTGSMSIPIATSPGRSGFGPKLSLSYDSGSGNGSFGLGWNLSLPSITRKTDKGLPKYQDAEESDVFILSGAEDLVPEFEKDAKNDWVLKDGKHVIHEIHRKVGNIDYLVRRYRPRIEGLFARIERWTNQSDPTDTFWRSISKDNITTWYGKTTESRIAESLDPSSNNPHQLPRIFSWLICQSHDDKGNVIVYNYKSENSDLDDIILAQANERNRSEYTRSANRYLKRIRYGNHTPYLPKLTETKSWPSLPGFDGSDTKDVDGSKDWYFEVVFDYGDHNENNPIPIETKKKWIVRKDPFSSYRAGFEVRTYRLCQRVLMFHHFPYESNVKENCLVSSTDFNYSYENAPKSAINPIYSFLESVSHTSYKRKDAERYLSKSLPPLEFQYSQVPTPDELLLQPIRAIDKESQENLPVGLDGLNFQWVDLDGEGLSGILTEQADAWFYKRNTSANHQSIDPNTNTAYTKAHFNPQELVAAKPNTTLSGGQAQFLDLAGDGQTDLVVMDGPVRGFYERTFDEDWEPFRNFSAWPNIDTRDPNLKFIDLTGDGQADILISEDNAFVWHASLAEIGFTPAQRVIQEFDEEKAPRIVFADGTQSIYLADFSGDGLTDIVRIRNGEVCYWPNLGYGRFGHKVTMDNSPLFDCPDLFDQRRIKLADIDGSGVTDILYLHGVGVKIYYNQSGNSWSTLPVLLTDVPATDNLKSVTVVDLLGNGTACLVWSSPLPGDAPQQMHYLDLMNGQKPHLLIKSVNNLGAETKIQYAPSTKFYLDDKRDGKPWITKLPFPVHVVERVEAWDHISRNRFVTRYAYHHGYFDGIEREFRGFGMVDQWDDTEEISYLVKNNTLWDTELKPSRVNSNNFQVGDNYTIESYVPTVHTKTWFHTGIYFGRDQVSNYFAGLLIDTDQGEYYREPNRATNEDAQKLLLPDTNLPPGLTFDEEREACRSLKGAMLRQEIFALDGTPKQDDPYTVTEQNFTIEQLQPQSFNMHSVFFTHPCEAISIHYERNPEDPRIQHELTLAVDPFGNVLKSVAIGYGRRMDSSDSAVSKDDKEKQRLIHITYTENEYTNEIIDTLDDYRTPLPAQSSTYEVRKAEQDKSSDGITQLYGFNVIKGHINQAGDGKHDIDYEDIGFAQAKQAVGNDKNDIKDEKNKYFRRLIEQLRTLYRPDDLGSAQNNPFQLLPLKTLQPMGLPGESYKLAFTPGLLEQVFTRPHDGQSNENLLPNFDEVLTGQGGDHGGYLQSQTLKADGRFLNTDPDNHWWIPSGRTFYTENPADNASQELTKSLEHFFLPRRYGDPFGKDAIIGFDKYDLLMSETIDAMNNRITVEEYDYRVLQPRLVSDPNRNQTAVAFDTLGMVVGTAVMGKPLPDIVEGDSLEGFEVDLSETQILNSIDNFYDAPELHTLASKLLNKATTRIIYDLERFRNTQKTYPDDQTKWLPPYAATLARETHHSQTSPPQGLKIQISFSYSDGFGREIQKKIQAEPGSVPKRNAKGEIIIAANGQPELTAKSANPRWVGSGWTIFNNKGKPVRQFESFFSDTHRFEFGIKVGVSPVLFYDPVDRVIATLHPNHTYEKVVFDPWQQTTYDVNDTVTFHKDQTGDPRTDPDIMGYVEGYFKTQPDTWKTWHQERIDDITRPHEQKAAEKAVAHADTPTTAHFDALGRPFLTVTHNRVASLDHELNGKDDKYITCVILDIEGNQRKVIDANNRIVMQYDYDMLGNKIYQISMEAGARWMLNDVSGKPIRIWDSRGHNFTTVYDALRRPIEHYVRGTTNYSDSRTLNNDILVDQIEYGEGQVTPEAFNLRTRIYRHKDSAGVMTNAILDDNHQPVSAYDFKGNPLHSTRQLISDYTEIPNWSKNPILDEETFASSTFYDALNRPIQTIAPHSSLGSSKLNIIQPEYNEANFLDKLHIWLDQNGEPDALLNPNTDLPSPTLGVNNIDYDAKGQRQRIDYKNGTSTVYQYDPLTFRLINLLTLRDAATFPNDNKAQDLHYTYDPAGNITHIQDDAQQPVFFKNCKVEPSNDYTYDAIYRLIAATGREHLGQGGSPIPHSYNDSGRVGISSADANGRFSANDCNAMGTYIERYVYDAVGNFQKMQHWVNNQAQPGWTREYTYREASLIEPTQHNNQLSQTVINANGNSPILEPYQHDAHGNMTAMPHLTLMQWDYKDQLQATSRQVVNQKPPPEKVPETTFYVYDASGQRVRKVTVGQNGKPNNERIYLGGFEIYRQFQANGKEIALERETLHIMDDKQRIALVETRTQGDDGSPSQLIRYQFGNHLGSASLELDDKANVISYEEYFPYGSTSYQAVDQGIKAAVKRYRYTGKERDEETGFGYHGARYYAAWLGRWVSCDSSEANRNKVAYEYVLNNPIRFHDPNGKDPVTASAVAVAEESGVRLRAAKSAVRLAGTGEAIVTGTSTAAVEGGAATGTSLATGGGGGFAISGTALTFVGLGLLVLGVGALIYSTHRPRVPELERTFTPAPPSSTQTSEAPKPVSPFVVAPPPPLNPDPNIETIQGERLANGVYLPHVPKKDEGKKLSPTAGAGGAGEPPKPPFEELTEPTPERGPGRLKPPWELFRVNGTTSGRGVTKKTRKELRDLAVRLGYKGDIKGLDSAHQTPHSQSDPGSVPRLFPQHQTPNRAEARDIARSNEFRRRWNSLNPNGSRLPTRRR